MIDTHCHLNDSQFADDLEKVIGNFSSAGVGKVICIGWDFESSEKARTISDENDNIYYSVGVHPDNCNEYDEKEFEELLKLRGDRLVAVGEIGLDYFHNKDNKSKQKYVFESQINLANIYKLPIIIHCREAFADTIEILKKYFPLNYGAVMHCYSGSLDTAKILLKLGVKLSFTGTVSYKNAINIQEVAKNIPNDSFFIETDSPYLTPVPHRGERNEPKFVVDVAKKVAELRNISFEELENITDKNAKLFFKLK